MFEQDEDNEKEDFFESSVEETPVKPEEPAKPRYTPDDPRYWEEPEDEFEHLRPRGRVNWKVIGWIFAAGLLVGLMSSLYIYLFKPYETEAHVSGYVERVAKRGDIFITYEGVLLPYKNIMDTTRVYEGDFLFSTKDPSIAARLKDMEFSNLPVRVSYKVYHVALPWRGEREIVVTGVDSVNARDLLPPDRQPDLPTLKAEETPEEK